jgi:hypothetical protein
MALLLAAALTSCDSPTRPNPTEAWSADITSTSQVLFMAFTRRGATLTGNATLADLLGGGPGEALLLTGTRRADTLDIAFVRQLDGTYHFVGWYVANGNGITGTIDGGTFNRTAISFRR